MCSQFCPNGRAYSKNMFIACTRVAQYMHGSSVRTILKDGFARAWFPISVRCDQVWIPLVHICAFIWTWHTIWFEIPLDVGTANCTAHHWRHPVGNVHNLCCPVHTYTIFVNSFTRWTDDQHMQLVIHFIRQIRWNLHNFLDPVSSDGVLLYSAVHVNAH